MLMTEERIMLDIEEARTRLDLSDSTVRRLVKEGKLRAYRIGRRLKFRPEDLDAYVEAQVYQPKPKEDDPEAQP
jgi:excisionase family DNA binding protein